MVDALKWDSTRARVTSDEGIAISTWTIMTLLLLAIALWGRIGIVSTFTTHSPVTGLVLLAFIPVIGVFVKDRAESTQLSLGGRGIAIVVVMAVLGLYLSFSFLTDWLIHPFLLVFYFLIPLPLLWHQFGIPLNQLGLAMPSKQSLMKAAILAIVYGALVFVVVGYNELDAVLNAPYETSHLFVEGIGQLPNAIVFSIPIVLLLIALPEEFLFRAIVQTSFTDRFGTTRGILLASLVFGLFHVPANYIGYLIILGAPEAALIGALFTALLFQAQVGIVLGMAWERTRNLLLPVLLHTAHNVMEMTPVFLWLVLVMT